MGSSQLDAVRSFWQSSPVCAAQIPHPLGSPEYFAHFDRLRQDLEPLEFAYWLHEYRRFAGKRVLDVGCGNGYVLSYYAKEGAEVTGIDLTDAGVALSHQRFEQLGLRGEFRVANAEKLPFADSTFDCVCSMGVLHHTPDTKAAVAEMFRVLKPGGRLIVMFYHRGSALYRIKMPLLARRLGVTLEEIVNQVDGVGNPKGEVYSKDDLRALLREFGELELFAGLLRPEMVLPVRFVVGKAPPQRFVRAVGAHLLRPFERRWGWFLYARGFKP